MSRNGRAGFRRLLALAAVATAALLPAGAAPKAAPTPAAPRPIDVPTLKREIAARKGKVVVVNLWATWCSGCVEEFPDMVRAANADRAQGMELLTISFDDAPNVAKAVVPFLAKNKQTTGAFVNRKGSQLDDSYPQFFEPKLAADDPYGIPRTYIFDRHGKLVKALVGQQSFDTFQSVLKPILSQK